MSKLAHLSTNKIIISRKTTTSGYKKIYATVTAGLGHIQPVSPEKTNLLEGVMGKTYMIYTDGDVDIEEGDKLRDVNTGNVYQVKNGGVTRRTVGIVDYNQVVIVQVN